MPIPDFQSITLPLLRLAARGNVRTRDAVEKLADEFGLTEAEREEVVASGRQTRFANRVYWAITYLKKAGLVSRIERGLYGITEQGKVALDDPPARLDIRFLSQFEGIKEFRNRSAKYDEPDVISAVGGTPEERIETALEESHEALREELLERILAMKPVAFERFILDLMLGMGYGVKGSGQHLGRASDGGVDGLVNEDVLGLDVIYLQAKRYAMGNNIGVEKIREFAGALDERGATKGVFVTTSKFAASAWQYAERSPKRLILIDGDELTRLATEYGVAVRISQSFQVKKIDLDYFYEIDS